MRKISLELTDEQADYLDDVVGKGEYATLNAAIFEALEEWQWDRQVQLLSQDNERLRELWAEGVASGSAGPMDFETVLKKARDRFAEARLNAA